VTRRAEAALDNPTLSWHPEAHALALDAIGSATESNSSISSLCLLEQEGLGLLLKSTSSQA
jgi:hypothetical protein